MLVEVRKYVPAPAKAGIDYVKRIFQVTPPSELAHAGGPQLDQAAVKMLGVRSDRIRVPDQGHREIRQT